MMFIVTQEELDKIKLSARNEEHAILKGVLNTLYDLCELDKLKRLDVLESAIQTFIYDLQDGQFDQNIKHFNDIYMKECMNPDII